MTVGYEIAVLIISFALFGAYCLAEEIWQYCRKDQHLPATTILLIVQNAEYEIEQLVRTIVQNLPNSELLIVDIASNDMTRPILQRLARDHGTIRIIHRGIDRHAAADGIALARGSIIHIYDMVHRINPEECLACLKQLARIT